MKSFIHKTLLLIVVALFIPFQATADSAGKVTRVIDMEAVEGSPYINTGSGQGRVPPEASVTIVSFADFNDSARINIHGLVNQHWYSGAAYALYLTDEISPENYIHGSSTGDRFLFNGTGQDGGAQIWTYAPDGIGVDTPVITAFIALEPDDGRAFDYALDADKLIFVGTSLAD